MAYNFLKKKKVADGKRSLRKPVPAAPKSGASVTSAPADAAAGQSAASSVPTPNAGQSAASPGSGTDTAQPKAGSGAQQSAADTSFDDYYNRLVAVLKSYGVGFTLPSLDELYSQLESFLRPSVDTAIENRRERGETNMAELDTDAFARGMGGSSYLSSMKKREGDSIESDIAQLESNYHATLSEYVYKAANELSDMQRQLALTYAQYSASGRSNGSVKHSGSSSGTAEGNHFDGEFVEGDHSWLKSNLSYEQYTRYIARLSDYDRYLLFHSTKSYWRDQRRQLQYNLSQTQYAKLVAHFDNRYGSGGGGSTWQQMLY